MLSAASALTRLAVTPRPGSGLAAPGDGRADSAGTDPADALNPSVVTGLAERGIPLTGVTPKPITNTLVAAAGLVTTMGRHISGPTLPGSAAHQQHWQLDFPR